MMEPFKVLLTISVFASVALIAAPATVPLKANPNQGSTIIPVVTREPLSETVNITLKPNIRATPLLEEEERTLERFFRVYEDGTVEYKIVLSNGVAQYQKITNKSVCNKIIQVYEGYHSEPLPDKTYRTTYYIADENGYRRLRREFDTKPPVLPVYVPYVPTVTPPVAC